MTESQSQQVDFFQLVSWLQRSRPDRAEIGHLGDRGLDIGEEALRLRPTMSLAFPTRDIESLGSAPADGGRSDRVLVDVNFSGLYGSDGALPVAFSEYFLQDRPEDAGDDKEAVRDFLDIFHHRLYSLLFRTWEKRRYHTSFQTDGSDDISQMLFALAGLGTRPTQSLAGVDGAFTRFAIMRHAGLLLQRPRSAAVLHSALQDFLGAIPVRVEQFVERRFDLPDEDRTYLTSRARLPVDGGFAAPRALGVDAVLGGQMRDRTSAICIEIGPLALDEYEDLLPGSDRRRGLDGLVQRIAPIHLEHDVRLLLPGEEVPKLKLTARSGVQLGWTSWIRRDRAPDHAVTFSGTG